MGFGTPETQASSLNQETERADALCVVVVTYNGSRWVRPLLDSLEQSTVLHHVVVVDNHSEDNTADIIGESYPYVRLIRMPENVGFGQANNKGIAHALMLNAECILLLNQDAMVFPDTIEKLRNAMRAHPEYGILSPVHLNYSGTQVDEGFLQYVCSEKQVLSSLLMGKPAEVYEIPVVNAAIWLLSRGALEKAGGFDPLFFHGGEDDDLRIRIQFHGLKVGLVPGAMAYHSHESFGLHVRKTSAEMRDFAYSRTVLKLKRLDRSFFRNACGVIKCHVFGILGNLLKFRLGPATRDLRTLVRVLSIFGRIRLHRDQSLREGRNWIL